MIDTTCPGSPYDQPMTDAEYAEYLDWWVREWMKKREVCNEA